MNVLTMLIKEEIGSEVAKWQAKDLERLIKAKAFELCREAFAELLAEYQDHLLKWRGSDWCLKDRLSKRLDTIFGEVVVERYRVVHKVTGQNRYVLDEALGLGRWEKATKEFQEMVVKQTVQRSYAQSSAEIANQSGIYKNKMSTWRFIQKESSKRQKKAPRALGWKRLGLPICPHGQDDPCPAMGIDLDATYCRHWKNKRYAKDHAVRVAVLYRHKVRVSKKRWLLKDKQVIASGPSEPLERFLNRVLHKAVTDYGLHQKTQVVVHGDGDPWIRLFAAQYFPSALYRLDPWHVKKRIKEALALQQIPDSWHEYIYGKPDALIGEIKKLQIQFEENSADYEKIQGLIGYLKNNREGLLPSNISREVKEKHPRLFKRGSGTIERNIAWTVNDRFKQPRMSWTRQGLENLLFLRENYLNNYQQPKYPAVPSCQKSITAYL